MAVQHANQLSRERMKHKLSLRSNKVLKPDVVVRKSVHVAVQSKNQTFFSGMKAKAPVEMLCRAARPRKVIGFPSTDLYLAYAVTLLAKQNIRAALMIEAIRV